MALSGEGRLLAASFVPPKPIRTLRNLTRYRKTQISDRQREADRLHKILEDTENQLDCVASDILGASGRAMLKRWCRQHRSQRTRRPRSGSLRKKIPALREALVGRFQDEHTLIVGRSSRTSTCSMKRSSRCPRRSRRRSPPFAPQRDLLITIPERQATDRRGADRRGRRRHERLPNPQAPRVMGKGIPRQRPVRRQTPLGQDRRRQQMAQSNLAESANAAARSKNAYLAAQYQRLRGRRGHDKAITAVGHSILTAAWHMLRTEAHPTSAATTSPTKTPTGSPNA